ncbi:hypothetical protein BDY19DRAFT_484327 [Irpex rosettiformis]|uniref:Uncharacterized protein n=1 Tax=Irpex rosettiformis TaxID=378272 RepID=A0ACB8UDN5_9APHY|nr:hypothetical protein BDY19DRAFT_484327 [Irpex rosettiformis]
MSSNWLSLPQIRTIVFGVVTVFSIIELALSAHSLSATNSFGFYFTYDAFALAVSLLSLLTIPAMFVIDLLRRGAFTSLILVELIWLGILWVLWLASAADSASATSGADCNLNDFFFIPSWFSTVCNETKAVTAFGWLTWAALTGYLVDLLVVSINAHNSGKPIWKSSVRDASSNNANSNLGMSSETKAPVSQQQHQVPVLQQTYPPQQAVPPASNYPGTATV